MGFRLVPAVHKRERGRDDDLATCARELASLQLPEDDPGMAGGRGKEGLIFYALGGLLCARLRGHPACRIEFGRPGTYVR